MKIYATERIEATRITTHHSNFSKDADWRKAYFILLSWKNTYGIPFHMDICSTGSGEAYLNMIVKRTSAERVVSYLESLGYGNIIQVDIIVMKIEPEWDETVDYYVADF